MYLALTGVPLIIVSIIAFILILSLIVTIHEAGHFFFAKKAGILCHEFSIGMGPLLYKKQFGETAFCIRAIPIGGFVSMAGEEIESSLIKPNSIIGLRLDGEIVKEIVLDDNATADVRGEVVTSDLYGKNGEVLFITLNEGVQEKYYQVKRDAFYLFEKGKKMQITPYDRSFESKSLWQRFITIFAGPCMNLILAIVLYLILAFATGVTNYSSSVIGEITGENYPAYGILQSGDEITMVNDRTVTSWTEFTVALDELYSQNITNFNITYKRDNISKTEQIEVLTNIVSIGLTNYNVTKKDFPDGVSNGLIVGEVALRYQDDKNKGSYQIKNGDILTKVRFDKYVNGNYETGQAIDLTSNDWGKLAGLFRDTNLANVYFEYYSYEKNGIVPITDCVPLQTYTNEVLENQRIEKIQMKIGVSPTTHFDFFGSIGLAFENFWNDFTLIFRTLKLLIAPSDVRQVGVQNLSSIVGIFGLVEKYIGAGFLALLSFVALLSVNIGVMNLLPIPALDGGRIVFLGYELITRRKPSKKFENICNNVFFILLMLLFVYITFNDILRLF